MAEVFDVPTFDLEGIIAHDKDGWALTRPVPEGGLEVIGKAVPVAHWRTGFVQAWNVEIMYQCEVTVGNKVYTGRTYGPGSWWRGKLKKEKTCGKRVSARN